MSNIHFWYRNRTSVVPGKTFFYSTVGLAFNSYLNYKVVTFEGSFLLLFMSNSKHWAVSSLKRISECTCKHVLCMCVCIGNVWCESQGSRSFAPGCKDPGFVRQYLWNEAITSLYIISDATKYEIIWTENDDVIDSFIPEIFTFKACLIRVIHSL